MPRIPSARKPPSLLPAEKFRRINALAEQYGDDVGHWDRWPLVAARAGIDPQEFPAGEIRRLRAASRERFRAGLLAHNADPCRAFNMVLVGDPELDPDLNPLHPTKGQAAINAAVAAREEAAKAERLATLRQKRDHDSPNPTRRSKVSYKCQICSTQVPAGIAMRRHVVSRRIPTMVCTGVNGAEPGTRLETAREIAVCEQCEYELKCGATVAELQQRATLPPKPFVPPVSLAPPPETGKPVRLGGRNGETVAVKPAEPAEPLKPAVATASKPAPAKIGKPTVAARAGKPILSVPKMFRR